MSTVEQMKALAEELGKLRVMDEYLSKRYPTMIEYFSPYRKNAKTLVQRRKFQVLGEIRRLRSVCKHDKELKRYLSGYEREYFSWKGDTGEEDPHLTKYRDGLTQVMSQTSKVLRAADIQYRVSVLGQEMALDYYSWSTVVLKGHLAWYNDMVRVIISEGRLEPCLNLTELGWMLSVYLYMTNSDTVLKDEWRRLYPLVWMHKGIVYSGETVRAEPVSESHAGITSPSIILF